MTKACARKYSTIARHTPIIVDPHMLQIVLHQLIILSDTYVDFWHCFWQEYFYGLFGELSPPLNSVHLDELHVFTINSSKKSRKRGEEKVEVVAINIGQDYIGSVLAVSHTKQPNQLISRYTLKFVQLYHVKLGILCVNNVFYVYLYMEIYVSIVYTYITHVYYND